MRHLLTAMLLICFTSISSFTAHAADGKRPNVLFFAVDDLRPEFGAYGNTLVKSPNLDKLAASGTTFLRAYCQQAVCSPSRTSLMTGARPDTTKIYDLQSHFRRTIPNVVTLAQHFKNNGYHTESMGKIYHGGLDDVESWSVPSWNGRSDAPADPAKNTPGKGKGKGKKSAFLEPGDELFIDFAGLDNDVDARRCADAKAVEELEKRAREQQAKRRTAQRGPAFAAPDVPDNELLDGKLSDRAIQRLRDLKQQDKPFFLAVGFLKPHLPFIAPKKYWDLYDPAAIPAAANPYRPKNETPYTLTNSGELRAYDGIPKSGPIDGDLARQLKHGYYACVSFLDAQVGRVLDELAAQGLADNTIVVLWGDHGWKLGEHNEWCKHSNMENDTNAPLLVRAPGMKAGQKTRALVEFVDIYPSLCELAGLPLPSHLEGVSFVPVLQQPDRPWKPAAFSQYPRSNVMGYSMKTDRYRFTRWVDRKDGSVKAVELYDHQTDPQENVNIAGDSAQAKLIAELMKQSEAGWQAAKPK